MLGAKHCRATVIKSKACTPGFASASVSKFLQEETNIAPDVHRNLNLAITALQELEQRRAGSTDLAGTSTPAKVGLPEPNTTAHFTVLIQGADPRNPAQYVSPANRRKKSLM